MPAKAPDRRAGYVTGAELVARAGARRAARSSITRHGQARLGSARGLPCETGEISAWLDDSRTEAHASQLPCGRDTRSISLWISNRPASPPRGGPEVRSSVPTCRDRYQEIAQQLDANPKTRQIVAAEGNLHQRQFSTGAVYRYAGTPHHRLVAIDLDASIPDIGTAEGMQYERRCSGDPSLLAFSQPRLRPSLLFARVTHRRSVRP
jgi:hypothetical protein